MTRVHEGYNGRRPVETRMWIFPRSRFLYASFGENFAGDGGAGINRKSVNQYGRCTTISDFMINDRIRDREVRVIGPDGEQLGIMSAREALEKAEEAELDLVKIAPTAKPPVCRIVDFGKFRYEQEQREKDAKKKQRVTDIKEIRLSPNIDQNDLNTKAAQARKFLTKGDRVKVTLRFRGREMMHLQNGRKILDDFFLLLKDVSVVDKPPKMEGRSMIMFLSEKR